MTACARLIKTCKATPKYSRTMFTAVQTLQQSKLCLFETAEQAVLLKLQHNKSSLDATYTFIFCRPQTDMLTQGAPTLVPFIMYHSPCTCSCPKSLLLHFSYRVIVADNTTPGIHCTPVTQLRQVELTRTATKAVNKAADGGTDLLWCLCIVCICPLPLSFFLI